MWEKIKFIMLGVLVGGAFLLFGYITTTVVIAAISAERTTIAATVIGVTETSNGGFIIVSEGEHNGVSRVFQSKTLYVNPELGLPETIEVVLLLPGNRYEVDVGGRR
jgi:hypothetical protein